MSDTAHAPKSDETLVGEITRQQVLGRVGIFMLIIVVTLAGLAQAENMTAFPFYADSEGANIANAWAFLRDSSLSPYTYAYEEAPLGTFIIAGWGAINNGFNNYGFVINSGRVLMFGLHLISVMLVFGIAKKLSDSDVAATVAALLFAFSPLVTSIQRRVLVDNIMMVLVLLSFYLIVGRQRNLYNYIFAGLIFGAAVLTKTSAVFFYPAYIFTLRLQAHKHHKRFALNLFVVLSILVMSLYPLYAQMREELFPQGWILGGDFPHVSLVDRLLDRGPETDTFLNIGNGFSNALNEWTTLDNLTADPVLFLGGIIAMVFITVLARDARNTRPLVAMVGVYLIGMLLAGNVVVSDAIALLPFFAIAISLMVFVIARFVSGEALWRRVLGVITLGILLYPFGIFYSNRLELYELDQVTGQIEAVDWVLENVPEDEIIVTDNYAYVTLVEARGQDRVHDYFRVDVDPDVKFTELDDDQCNIDWVITTPQVLSDIEVFRLDLMRRTIENAEPILTFENEGWPVQIWQVSKRNCASELNEEADDDAPTDEDAELRDQLGG